MTILTLSNALLIISILLFIAILAGQTSYRFGVPILILFLGVGMLAGSEGFGKIEFGYSHADAVQFLGTVALCFILFSGGMDTRWKSVKPVVAKGAVLSTVGVILTAFFIGVCVHYLTHFNWMESFLLGSIVSSTDAAAVFNILNSHNLSLKNNLKPLLEFESGSNDPVAYLLTVMFVSILGNNEVGVWHAVWSLIWQLFMGALLGLFMGRMSTMFVNRVRIGHAGLYPVLCIALMFFTYSFTDLIGGNGLLAVYICGIFVGNRKLAHRQNIVGSFDGYAWLMQLLLFLTLGLMVFPSHVWMVKWKGLLIAGAIILVARPLAVFICMLFFKNRPDFKSQLFISWVGLRGAAPIVFATFPLAAGLPDADMIFSLVFFISFLSMALQGSTIPWVARKLHLAVVLPTALISRRDLDPKTEMLEIEVEKGAPLDGKTLLEADLPEDVRVTMIMRLGEYIVPNGNTLLVPHDRLYLLCKNPDEVRSLLEDDPDKPEPDSDSKN